MALVAARVNLKYVAPGLMQPGHDDDLVAGREPVESGDRECRYVKPGVRGALRTLFGRIVARLDGGSNDANRTQPGSSPRLPRLLHGHRGTSYRFASTQPGDDAGSAAVRCAPLQYGIGTTPKFNLWPGFMRGCDGSHGIN